MTPQVRTGLTHLGTAFGGAVAAIGFMSSHSVDLYAIWNQMHEVAAAITKLVAMVTPIATGAYAVYKSSTKETIKDVVADPKAPAIAAQIEPTPQVLAVADALKKA